MPQGESFPNPLDSLSVDIDANHLVGGQLSKFVEVWRTMGAPEGVLKVIRGYAIPFSSRPPLLPLSIPLPPCCLTPSSPLMDIQVKKLVDQRVLVRNPFDSGYLSPLFLVSKADGSQRPIINLKRLNLFLSLKKFHLINHFRLPDFLQKGDFLAKIDLSQAYFHVPIRPSHQRFLSVAYRDSLYCMTCLPFGLASAPQIFSSLTNWVASLLRKLGIRVIVYLDDFLLANQNPDCLRSQALMTVRILQNLGWTVNLAKSVLTPALSCQYLGIVWNPTSDFKSLPPGKQSVIYRYLLVILQSRLWSWKISKVILGYLSFAAFVVPLGKLHYRQIQWASRHLPRHQPLRQSVIPNRALSQIQWWLGALHRTSPIFPPSPQAFLTTDASNSGWGAVVNNLTFRGAWGEHQKEWHINLKEMFAVRRALELNLSLLQNKAVLVQSDNRTVVSYIHREGGTKSLKLLQEVERLFSVAACYNIGLIGRFIPGRYNAWADNLSRQKRLPDWNLSQNVTHLIFAQWGVPEIDLFCDGHLHGSSSVRCSVDPGSPGAFCRCLLASVEILPCLDFPAPPSCPSSSELGGGPVYSSRPLLGEGVLVARPGSSCSSPSHESRRPGREPDRSGHGSSSPRREIPEFAGLVGSGWLSQVPDWDQPDLELLRSAWRDSTLRTYKAPWKRWLDWTARVRVSINDPSPQDLAKFLSWLHSQKFSYSSILVHKSVVANFANPARTTDLITHPVVRQILKAISLKKIPENKEIWDVSVLTSWISSHPPSEDSHFEVSRHVAILLLLCSGRRVHDLTLLLTTKDRFQDLVDSIVFWPAFGSKTDSAVHRQSGWKLNQNPYNSLFDPVFWVRKLISLSANRIRSKNVDSLFITTRGVVKAASRSVIAGWIRTAMTAAGINASAGSFRSAVGSSRMTSNSSLDSILKKGNWKSERNFLKHYFKPIAKKQTIPSVTMDHCFDPI
uniref:Enzymatic polyprotein n=1 Tax=Cacopsylla melanoneura TaxID=428564 RepID=A0A8D8SPA0_9HEMI